MFYQYATKFWNPSGPSRPCEANVFLTTEEADKYSAFEQSLDKDGLDKWLLESGIISAVETAGNAIAQRPRYCCWR
jgi:hypothetical protein